VNILFFSQHFWPENFIINDLVRTFSKDKSSEISVLTSKPNYPKGVIYKGYNVYDVTKENYFGANLFRVPVLLRKKSFLGLFLNYLSFIISATILTPFLLWYKRINIIFVYGTSPILQVLPAIFISFLKKAKLIIWVQDLWPESVEAAGYVRNKYLLSIIRFFVKYIYAKADLILVQSQAFEQKILSINNKCNVLYLPNFAPSEYEKNIDLIYKSTHRVNEIFEVVYAGNLGRAQNLDVILKAFKLLVPYKKIKFYLIGEGSYKENLIKQTKELNLHNVVFVEFLPLKNLKKRIKRSSLLLLSLKENEVLNLTIPSKFQAYLTFGKPILVAANGEVSRLVKKSQSGTAVSPISEFLIANSILHYYKMNPLDRAKIGLKGLNFYKKNYHSDIIYKKLRHIMFDLIKN
jgi:glycosyltransferase involved in cell wall biosynthesis